MSERKCRPEVHDDGAIYTNAPFDLFKIYSDIFDVVKAKRLKDLILKTLTIIQEGTQSYQQALKKLVLKDK